MKKNLYIILDEYKTLNKKKEDIIIYDLNSLGKYDIVTFLKQNNLWNLFIENFEKRKKEIFEKYKPRNILEQEIFDFTFYTKLTHIVEVETIYEILKKFFNVYIIKNEKNNRYGFLEFNYWNYVDKSIFYKIKLFIYLFKKYVLKYLRLFFSLFFSLKINDCNIFHQNDKLDTILFEKILFNKGIYNYFSKKKFYFDFKKIRKKNFPFIKFTFDIKQILFNLMKIDFYYYKNLLMNNYNENYYYVTSYDIFTIALKSYVNKKLIYIHHGYLLEKKAELVAKYMKKIIPYDYSQYLQLLKYISPGSFICHETEEIVKIDKEKKEKYKYIIFTSKIFKKEFFYYIPKDCKELYIKFHPFEKSEIKQKFLNYATKRFNKIIILNDIENILLEKNSFIYILGPSSMITYLIKKGVSVNNIIVISKNFSIRNYTEIDDYSYLNKKLKIII